MVSCRRKLHEWVLSRGKSHPGGRLHWGGLKDFADGSLGSRTALTHQPYTDDPSSRGVRLTPKETLQEMVTAADMTGLQVIPSSSHIMPVWNLESVLTLLQTARFMSVIGVFLNPKYGPCSFCRLLFTRLGTEQMTKLQPFTGRYRLLPRVTLRTVPVVQLSGDTEWSMHSICQDHRPWKLSEKLVWWQ